jgi:guanylate kinase
MTSGSDGLVVVLSGPSGGGKTSVCRELLRRRDDVMFSVSATSRNPRDDEEDGVDYDFVSRAEFERMARDGELLEWAEVHGQLYGTPRSNLERSRESGRALMLDIDVQGARQVRENLGTAVLVFLLPPSIEVLLSRLRGRGSEDDEAVRRRMTSALSELEAVGEFDYVVVNDDLDSTVSAVESILIAERAAVGRQDGGVRNRADQLARDLKNTMETL